MKLPIQILLPLTCFIINQALAQDKATAPRGAIAMESEVLNEKRKLQIHLPDNYDTNDSLRYPVIYVLDGEWHTGLNNWYAYKLAEEGVMSSAIVVGVINVDRNRDFLPTNVGKNSTSGKADRFLAFLKDELSPYIDGMYRTDGRNILTGHSFGGTFSMYAMLMAPDLFDANVVSDPAFWWDNDYLIKLAESKLPELKKQNKAVFIAGRAGHMSRMRIKQMRQTLRKYAPKGLKWKVKHYRNETHDSVTKKSFLDGLRFAAKSIQ